MSTAAALDVEMKVEWAFRAERLLTIKGFLLKKLGVDQDAPAMTSDDCIGLPAIAEADYPHRVTSSTTDGIPHVPPSLLVKCSLFGTLSSPNYRRATPKA